MLGCLLQTLEPRRLNLAYLVHDEPPAFHVALQFGERIGRNGFAFGGADVYQALRSLLQLGVEIADAEPCQGRLHAIDDASSLANESLVLTVGSFGILLRKRRNGSHLAVIPLAAQPAEKGAFQAADIEPIGLGTPVLPRDRHACGMNDMGLDAVSSQPAGQPETIPTGLEGDSNAVDLVSCLAGIRSPSLKKL